ncbi:MAG: hypothetical protein IJT82_06135 [Schwartzia sp.]|nr:hypothetical protein [Schwartzia sp. (in: firmicutes)]
MKPLSERMILYMDAGFPILYIATFEEDKADRAIIGLCNRQSIKFVSCAQKKLIKKSKNDRL